jgi:plasmid segregation protein ParM
MRTGVVDVGAYTVDLALNDDGEYIDAESGSVEGGVSAAQERVAALLEHDYRQKMPYKLVEAALRTGYFRARGEVVDYSAAVQEALAPLRSATLSLMGTKWQTGATLDVIYLSGGGAPLVADAVMGAYPQTTLVDQPQLANARGYLNYALFTARQPG